MVNLSKFAEMLEELMFEHDTRHKTDAKTLAKALGVEGSTITRYLRTEREPSIENLVLLADYFKCSADYLLGRESENRLFTFEPCPPFSEQLVKVLKEYGYTCYRLSSDAKIHQSSVYAWKSGKRMPNLDSIIKIAELFECSVDFVLGREK